MKKTLLLALLAIGSIAANAQNCSPDPQFTSPGIYPDSATGFSAGQVGVPYTQNITVITPADTVYQGFTVPVDRIEVTGVSGLPPGLVMKAENTTTLPFVYPGGTTSCAVIEGTPTQAGTYSPVIDVNAVIIVFGQEVANPYVIDYYTIVIVPATGINEFATMQMVTNYPNPFNENTTITFSVTQADDVQFEVFDLLGKQVFSETVQANRGENKYIFDREGLKSGVYMYTVEYKGKKVTKRMVIK